MDNSKWEKAFKIRSKDTGWLEVLIMVYGLVIGFILHCIQRRTITPIVYILIPGIFIVMPIIRSITAALFITEYPLLGFDPDIDYTSISVFNFIGDSIYAVVAGKLAIRHDRLVALDMLKKKKIQSEDFNFTQLTIYSLQYLKKDILYYFPIYLQKSKVFVKKIINKIKNKFN